MIFDGKTADQYCLRQKSVFWQMLSMTLTFEPLTLKMSPCHVDLVMGNCDKYHYIRSSIL